MTSTAAHSPYLLDSSQFQRRNLQDADGHLIWLSAILLGCAHGGVAILCLSFGNVWIALANIFFAFLSFGFSLFVKRFATESWVHPIGACILLAGTSFYLFGYPGPIVIFPYILLPVPAFRVHGLLWGGVLTTGFLITASLSMFGTTAGAAQLPDAVRINVMVALCISAGFGWAFEFARRRYDLNLEQTLKNLRVLHGVIPICSSCKMVREADDTWRQIEGLLHRKGQVEFSHGLCQDCLGDALEDLNEPS